MNKVFKSFDAVGKIGFNREVVKLQTSAKNATWKKKEISVQVDEGNGNKPYAVIVGQFSNILNINFKEEGKTEQTKLQVPYSDINNADLLKKVPDFKKFKIELSHILNIIAKPLAKKDSIKFTIEPNKLAKKVYLVGKLVKGIKIVDFDEVFNEITLETPLQEDLESFDVTLDIKYETLSDWDFVEFVEKNTELFQGKRLKMLGNIEISEYNNRVYDKYIVNKIYEAKEYDLNKFEATYGIFFKDGALNKDDLKINGNVILEGFTDYYKKDAKNKTAYAKLDFKFDFSKVLEVIKDEKTPAETKEKLTKRIEFMLKQFEQTFKDGTTESLKSDKVYYCDWKVRVVRGTEEKEITIEDLSDNQKGLIEYGIKTFDDIKAEMRGSLKGDKISELRLVSPSGKNPNGAEEAGIEIEDLFNAEVETPTAKVEEKVKETPPVNVSTADVDSLFAGL